MALLPCQDTLPLTLYLAWLDESVLHVVSQYSSIAQPQHSDLTQLRLKMRTSKTFLHGRGLGLGNALIFGCLSQPPGPSTVLHLGLHVCYTAFASVGFEIHLVSPNIPMLQGVWSVVWL